MQALQLLIAYSDTTECPLLDFSQLHFPDADALMYSSQLHTWAKESAGIQVVSGTGGECVILYK